MSSCSVRKCENTNTFDKEPFVTGGGGGGGTISAERGTISASGLCPWGTISASRLCPGGQNLRGDRICSDTGIQLRV